MAFVYCTSLCVDWDVSLAVAGFWLLYACPSSIPVDKSSHELSRVLACTYYDGVSVCISAHLIH